MFACASGPEAAYQLSLEHLQMHSPRPKSSQGGSVRSLRKTPRTQAGPKPWPEGLWSLNRTALKILPMHKGSCPAFQNRWVWFLTRPPLSWSPLLFRENEESQVFPERREKLETL